MPTYLVERQFDGPLELGPDTLEAIRRENARHGVRWIQSFLDPERSKTWCLYEANDPAGIRAAARALSLPVDRVTPVSEIPGA